MSNTTVLVIDEDIPLLTLVRALASQGLTVSGDRRGGLLVTTPDRVRLAGKVLADRAESEPSPPHRDPNTPEGCGCETSPGEGPCQPLADSLLEHQLERAACMDD